MVTVARAFRRHGEAVEALKASYDAIPVGSPVRLGKRTSNLFRPRASLSTPGLDVSGLTDVISIDREARTADVQGMCTYERLVEATLPHGLMPLVVPQLRTITLGGAVTGLGIESTSFRHGLPHESVLEMDILTGSGRLVTATSGGPHADLFASFPNSYGSLGYAVRLQIRLQPVSTYVALRHVSFTTFEEVAAAITSIDTSGSWDGQPVDFLDGVVFSPDRTRLTLGRGTDEPLPEGPATPSNYTGQDIFYRSVEHLSHDLLTIHDYLWRWDTDWFWCSRAFGAQQPVIRRLWPARLRRSDVYHRIVGWETRYGVSARVDRLRGRPPQERVVQDVDIPVDRLPSFLGWFTDNVAMLPVWLCPVRLARPAGPGSARRWPLYPLDAERLYVNVGFWGAVPIEPGRADGDLNRMLEAAVGAHEGHKSLYSDAFYDREEFHALYGGSTYDAVKDRYDPQHRLTGLYEKAVGRT